MKRFSFIAILIAAFSFSLWSCEKDDDDKTPIENPDTKPPVDEEPELKVTFGDEYDDLTNHGLIVGEVTSNIQVSWTSKLPKQKEIESDVYSFFHLKFQVQKKDTEELGSGNIWGFTGCAFECPEFATLDEYIEFEKLDLVKARKQQTEIWADYSDPVFVERLDDVEINGVTFAVVDFTVKASGVEIYNRNFYHKVSDQKFVIIRVETVYPLGELWPEVATEITNTINSLKVEVIEEEGEDDEGGADE